LFDRLPSAERYSSLNSNSPNVLRKGFRKNVDSVVGPTRPGNF